MSEGLFVATHKGLFRLERAAGSSPARWEITRTAFLGDPVSMMLRDPRDGTLFAALSLRHFGVKLHRSFDGGKSWEECQPPSYPRVDEPQAESESVSVSQIWSLEAGGQEEGVLWAGTIPGGLFRSTDRGSSWKLVPSLWERPERKEWFGGGYSEPGIHSICVNPRNSLQVTVGVSCGGVWSTLDGGDSWECRARGMRAEYMPPDRQEDCFVQDPHRLVQCPSAPEVMWVQHHNGVFKTTNGAESWVEISHIEPSSFGFAVAVHPGDPNTAWFVPGVKDECRIPVDARVVVTRTRDGGESFEVLSNGLPPEHAYDIVFRHGLDVDETGERLAMGSTTGSLWISENGGNSWTHISAHLPPIYCVRFE